MCIRDSHKRADYSTRVAAKIPEAGEADGHHRNAGRVQRFTIWAVGGQAADSRFKPMPVEPGDQADELSLRSADLKRGNDIQHSDPSLTSSLAHAVTKPIQSTANAITSGPAPTKIGTAKYADVAR